MRDHKRLQRIARIKERVKEVRRAELASAERTLDKARGRLEESAAQAASYREALTQPQPDANAADLLFAAEQLGRAAAEVRERREVFSEVKAERTHRAAALAKAGRELKSLELLDEQLAEEERSAERAREQRAQDENARAKAGEP